MSNWYYALGDSEKGPIPAAELKALAVDGTIGPDTLVWKDGMPDWKRAAEVPGLLSPKASNSSTPSVSKSASRSSAGSRSNQAYDEYDDYDDYGDPYQSPRGGRGDYARHPDGAGAILAMGIVSLIVFPILGIAAWIMGNNYLAECRRMGLEPEGSAVAGRICGIIAVTMMALVLLFVVGIFGIACLGGLGAAAGAA